MEKITNIEQAQEIVDTFERVKYLEEKLHYFSNGKNWSVSKIGDSRYFDVGNMIEFLSDEDQKAIDRYIVNKFKKAIREGKEQLKNINIE